MKHFNYRTRKLLNLRHLESFLLSFTFIIHISLYQILY